MVGAQFRHRENILRDLTSRHARRVLVLQTVVKEVKREAKQKQKGTLRAVEARIVQLEAALKQKQQVVTKHAAQVARRRLGSTKEKEKHLALQDAVKVARRRQRSQDHAVSSAEIDQLHDVHEKEIATLQFEHAESIVALELKQSEAQESAQLFKAYKDHAESEAATMKFNTYLAAENIRSTMAYTTVIEMEYLQAWEAQLCELHAAHEKQLFDLDTQHEAAIELARQQASDVTVAVGAEMRELRVAHKAQLLDLKAHHEAAIEAFRLQTSEDRTVSDANMRELYETKISDIETDHAAAIKDIR